MIERWIRHVEGKVKIKNSYYKILPGNSERKLSFWKPTCARA